MDLEPCKNDLEILTYLAEYRVLRISQLAVLQRRSRQAIRRRLRALRRHGLTQTATCCVGEDRGRPESLVSLTLPGVDLLKDRRLLARRLPNQRITLDDLRCLDHHLLVNEFCVQVVEMERIVPALSVRMFSAGSPLLYQTRKKRPVIHEKFQAAGQSGRWIEYTPDGVLATTHAVLQKTLLFFLEADRGTETLASPRRQPRDLRQKILNYQACLRQRHYKRYEILLHCALRGFRVLLLAHNAGAVARLARLVQRMPPSDFIWLTDRQSLISQGLWGPIWMQGGRSDQCGLSILGSKMPRPCPSPASVS